MNGKPLPPPLPPGERTVGQLVAESIRLYGRRFWRVLPLGLVFAVINQLAIGNPTTTQMLILLVFAPLLSLAYAGACLVAREGAVGGRLFGRAVVAGTLAFAPVPFLTRIFVLPGVAWLAFVGLVVPAILYEGLGIRAGFARATRLARADYIHALGSLATLVIVFVLTRLVLLLLLHGQADTTTRIAAFLADLVLSPLIMVGAALLYFDQAARVRYSADERAVPPG